MASFSCYLSRSGGRYGFGLSGYRPPRGSIAWFWKFKRNFQVHQNKRYGEKNPSFVVASFDSNDEKMEISQQVTYAMEKVTSDYHSGSSSEDEVYISQKTPSTPVTPRTCDPYQVPEFVPQLTLPAWNKNPKRRPSSHYQYQPRLVPGYQQGRNKVYGQVPWMPPVMQTEQTHWTNLHMLNAARQCLT